MRMDVCRRWPLLPLAWQLWVTLGLAFWPADRRKKLDEYQAYSGKAHGSGICPSTVVYPRAIVSCRCWQHREV
jgi:hypothetical protein